MEVSISSELMSPTAVKSEAANRDKLDRAFLEAHLKLVIKPLKENPKRVDLVHRSRYLLIQGVEPLNHVIGLIMGFFIIELSLCFGVINGNLEQPLHLFYHTEVGHGVIQE